MAVNDKILTVTEVATEPPSATDREPPSSDQATTGQTVHPDLNTLESLVKVKRAAQFLDISPSLVYAYVERKQIPHFRVMGHAIRFRLSKLDEWLQHFHVTGGFDE